MNLRLEEISVFLQKFGHLSKKTSIVSSKGSLYISGSSGFVKKLTNGNLLLWLVLVFLLILKCNKSWHFFFEHCTRWAKLVFFASQNIYRWFHGFPRITLSELNSKEFLALSNVNSVKSKYVKERYSGRYW